MKPASVSVRFTSPLETQWMNKPTLVLWCLDSWLWGKLNAVRSSLWRQQLHIDQQLEKILIHQKTKIKLKLHVELEQKRSDPQPAALHWTRIWFWFWFWFYFTLVSVRLITKTDQELPGAPGDHRWNSDHQRLWFHIIRGKITKQLCENIWIELKVHKYSPGVEVTNYHYSDYFPFGCFLTRA